MKEFNTDTNQFDNEFAKKFEGFAPTPKSNLWGKISDEMEMQDIDQYVKQELKSFETTPSEQVWNKVEKKIPLSLYLRNHLNQLSKIAAILVVGMLATIYFSQPQPSSVATVQQPNTKMMDGIISPFPETDFVFDLSEEVIEEEIASTVLAEEDKIKEADDFLASLLEDEDEFTFVPSNATLFEILEPAEQLPIENISAMIEEPTENVEMQIKIPLKVVEDHEVDQMIELYDQNKTNEN